MTETESAAGVETTAGAASWTGYALAGVVAGLAMGTLIWVMNDAVIAVAMPALYGLAPPPNPLGGWLVHLFHSVVFGLLFGGLLQMEALSGVVGNLPRSAVVGVAYGVVIWLVAAALVMPLWLSAVGFAGAPPFPNFAIPSLLWHAVFGLVLGALVPYATDL